jgi:hypothetical protein
MPTNRGGATPRLEATPSTQGASMDPHGLAYLASPGAGQFSGLSDRRLPPSTQGSSWSSLERTEEHPAAGSWMDGHRQEISYANPQSSNRNGAADRMDTWSSRSIWEQSNAAGVSQTFEQLSNVDDMPSLLPSQDRRLSWVPDRKCDSNFVAYIIKIVIQLLPRSRTSCHP